MPYTSGSKINFPKTSQMSQLESVTGFSVSVSISWSWFDKRAGIVAWQFTNKSVLPSTVILFRNGYYFGNAYFPIYLNNGITRWATKLEPLTDLGVQRNTMPIAIIDFGNGKRIVAFIFTLSGGQKWSVLEGGFSLEFPPKNIAVFDVDLEKSGKFCVGYDPRQVLDWDAQTGSNLKGYLPNPATFDTIQLSAPTIAPYVKLFEKDSVLDSECKGGISQSEQMGYAEDDIEVIIGNILRRIRNF